MDSAAVTARGVGVKNMLGISLNLNKDLSDDGNCQVLNNLALHDPKSVQYVNWKKIKQIPTCTLAEAVALSLNINPEYAFLPWVEQFIILLEKHSDKNAARRKKLHAEIEKEQGKKALRAEQFIGSAIRKHAKLFAKIQEQLRRFRQQLHIAERNLNPNGVLKNVSLSETEAPKVSLIEFSAWAAQHDWKLPEHFPRIEPKQMDTSAVDIDRPLETRERRTLLLIIAGLAHALKLNLSTPTASAEVIKSSISECGADLSVRVIEGKLKMIPDALKFFKK
jgi:hypothetical protein